MVLARNRWTGVPGAVYEVVDVEPFEPTREMQFRLMVAELAENLGLTDDEMRVELWRMLSQGAARKLRAAAAEAQ